MSTATNLASSYRKTCDFLQEFGVQLQLPQLTIATGFVYFHRFFAIKDFSEYDRINIAIACLFLAGKVEETPKKLKDVIQISHKLSHQFFTPKEKYNTLKLDSPQYEDLQKRIVIYERIILQALSFDLNVEHPYKYLLEYIKKMNGNRGLAQTAWNFVNDSLRSSLCLKYRPQLIACAAIYLASKRQWWIGIFIEAPQRDFDDICCQILELYPDDFPLKREVQLFSNGGVFGFFMDRENKISSNNSIG